MQALLNKLKDLNIKIDVVNKNLDIQAPKGAMTEDLLNEIRVHKNSLIEFITLFKTKKEEYKNIPSAPVQPSYAVSFSQYKLWLACQFEGGNVAYNIANVFEMEGNLDVSSLQKAFQTLIERHESLRTVFVEDESEEVRQVVLSIDEIKFELRYEDFSAEGDSEEKLKQSIQNETEYVFDLSTDSLLRAKLFKRSQNTYAFVYVLHHIISDGWSSEVMIKELFILYENGLKGKGNPLEGLKIQYKDYAEWQHNQLKNGELEEHKNYWLHQFAGEIPVLNVPIQKKRPLIKTYNGNIISKVLDVSIVEKLKKICESQGGTLFMGILSSVNVLLHKYSQQNDIIVGSAIAGREHVDLSNQIGFFVNTLPLRTRIEAEDNFIKLLNKVKLMTLAAYEHQRYPLEKVIESLSLRRDLSRNPLFDVMVDLQSKFDVLKRNDFDKLIEDLTIKPYYGNNNETSKFDLHFNFIDNSEEIILNLTYNTDLYSSDFIIQMINHFEQITKEIVQNVLMPFSQLEYLFEDEKKQVLFGFNSTKVEYSKDETIIDLFEQQVKKTPNSPAIVYGERVLTYEELNSKVNQLGHFLKETYSIQSDDLIGIKLERSGLAIIAILAILKAGAAYVPIDLSYPQERIAYIEKDSGCKTVLDDEELMHFDFEVFRYSTKNVENRPLGSNLAYVIYTSGSTGKPKGVMIEHKNLYNYLSWANDFYFKKEEEGSFGLISSLSFDLTITSIFLPLIRGAKLKVVTNELNTHKMLLDYVSDEYILDAIKLTPSHLELLKDIELSKTSLKKIILGGESLLKEHVNEIFINKKELVVYNEYGPTECTVGCMIKEVSNDDSSITIGKPISNTQIYILDEMLKPVPVGIIGKLYVSGAGVARGYLNKPELTQEKFISNPFISGTKMYDTGDLGKWKADGDIEFIGRNDHQVKIRGYRVELGEIESAILKYTELVSQVTVEVKKMNDEKVLIAFIVSQNKIDMQQLKLFLQQRLPGYMVPSLYTSLDEMPLTPNGKIDKNALLDISEYKSIRNKYVESENQIQQDLVVIWKEILSTDKIGIIDDFFDLGGNSIKVLKLIKRVHKLFGVEIPIDYLYKNGNIKNLAEEIELAVKLVKIQKGSKKNNTIKI